MKFRDIIVRSALVLLVLVSILLSVLIWTNNQRFSSSTNTTSLKVSKKDTAQQAMTVLPTQTFINQNDKTYQIYDAKKNLPLEFSNQMKAAKATKYQLVKQDDAGYQKFLNNDAYLQFSYSDSIPIKALLEIYKLDKLSVKNGINFNRIFVNQEKNNAIYLGNDKTEKVYKLYLSGFKGSKLYEFAQKAENKLDVVLTKMDNFYMPYYQDDNTINVYNYLISSQPDSYYVSKFFETSEVQTKNDGNSVIYSSGLYKRLNINHETGVFDFTNFEVDTVPKNLSKTLLSSYDYLQQAGINLANIRYFAHQDHSIDYHYFVEGLPVFIQDDFQAAIKTNFKASGLNIKFINLNLQIPIPADEQTATVPKTSTVIDTLVEKGYKKNKIKRVVLAFKLQQDPNNSEIISLVPMTYVKIDNQWKDYQSWLDANLAQN